MDDFDYQDPSRSGATLPSKVLNVLAVLALLATVCVAALVVSIFLNPRSSLNLFPPPTLPAALALPTYTPTPRGVLPPTRTPQPTQKPTQSATPRPTSAPLPTDTPASLPTETPFPLFTASPTAGGMPYILAQGSPSALSSLTFRPDSECNWMGVAGQVFNKTGAPVTGLIVKSGGYLNGKVIEVMSLSGVAQQYGQAGYELPLGEKPVAAKGSMWVQLLNQAGAPLSDRVFFDTFGDCQKNLIFINFKQAR